MKFGILGTGAMARVLGGKWNRAGHELFVGARSTSKAQELARGWGPDVGSGTLGDAARFGDVACIAIWPTGVLEAVTTAGGAAGAFEGRIVVDCDNPVETDRFTLTTSGISLAEEIARLARGSRVVKAFNQCQAQVWAMDPPLFDGRTLSVPICGDDPAAKSAVAELVADVGCSALDAGELIHARYLEAMAAVVIRQLFGGADPLTAFNLVSAGSRPIRAAGDST